LFSLSGHAIVSFHLFEIPTQMPTNEQIINVLRNLIDKQILNLIDPNRGLLHAICESLVIGPKGKPVNVKLFSLPNGDYMGEFTPKKIGKKKTEFKIIDRDFVFLIKVNIELILHSEIYRLKVVHSLRKYMIHHKFELVHYQKIFLLE